MSRLLDLLGVLCLLSGALLAFTAAVGLVRFPDLLTRMHAATKPQTLGLILVLSGVALLLREPSVVGVLTLTVLAQLMTAPVSAHMVGRRAIRTTTVDESRLFVNELREHQTH
ncbi:monovalent cation/H(+) antiporter subunit G [Actinomycetota bacterium]